jgi:hypothetical protein
MSASRTNGLGMSLSFSDPHIQFARMPVRKSLAIDRCLDLIDYPVPVTYCLNCNITALAPIA